MHHARPPRNAPRNLAGALFGATGLVLLLVAGCTMVGDRLTGVGLNAGGPVTCIKQCNDLYKTLYDQEQKLHDANVEACQALAQPDRGTCLDAEDARHTAEMTRLGDAKINCQNTCHTQGSGTAG